jgi:hypothetical protein
LSAQAVATCDATTKEEQMRHDKCPKPRPRLTILLLVSAATFAAVPALAQALPAPDDRATSHELPSNAQLDQQDRLGPKYVTAHYPSSSSNLTSEVERPAGFEWRDGRVTGGIAALALALVAAARLLRYRRGRDRTEKKGFASA